MSLEKKLMAALCAMAVSVAGFSAYAATIHLQDGDDIATDTTWLSTNVYWLEDAIYVTNQATLTIEAGTLIRGEQASGTNDWPGALVVSQGAKIRAQGTASEPIVMTGVNDDHALPPSYAAGTSPWSDKNNKKTSQWGGLIVLGEANVTHSSPGPYYIEGLPAKAKAQYGGTDDDDDSGELHYVDIRYGGYALQQSEEINGLTMGAVGRATEIDHISVTQNSDDAYEWFGGTVNTKYMVAWGAADDSFDWDEGYRGKGQFWLGVKSFVDGDFAELTQSDHLCEMDGAGGDDAETPASVPTIYNATFVGLGGNTNNNPSGHDDLNLLFRDGGGGRFYNSMFLDFGGAVALIEGNLTDADDFDSADKTQQTYVRDAAGYFTHNVGGRKLEVKNSVIWNVEYPDAKSCTGGTAVAWFDPDDEWGADHDKDHLGAEDGYSLLSEGMFNLDLGTSPFELPIKALTRETDADWNGYYPVASLDPRIKDTRYISTAMPVDTNDKEPNEPKFFYDQVGFQGCMHKYNWATWTLPAKQGMLATGGVPAGDYGDWNNVSVDITKSGDMVSVSVDVSDDVYEGQMAEYWIYYERSDDGRRYFYDFEDGDWHFRGIRSQAMALGDIEFKDILDVSSPDADGGQGSASIPTDSTIYVQVDHRPNGILDYPRFENQTATISSL